MLILAVALLALLLVGGLAIAMTNARIRATAREIKAVEVELAKLADARRDLDEKLARARDSIYLREKVGTALRQANPDQIVNVRRRYEPAPTSLRTTPRDPRFTALDIAFIPGPTGGATAR